MKKLNLFILALCAFTYSNAQIVITEENDTPIVNNETYSYSELGIELPIFITNQGDEAVRILAEVVNMNNASGSNLQFCVGGTCYANIAIGNTYPLNGPLILQPGGDNGQFDHFFSSYPGDNTEAPVDYTFRFYEVDENGNELGDLVTFTYLYDSSLSTSNFSMESLGVTLNSSIIVDKISFNANAKVSLAVYDLNGKRVESQSFEQGSHQLNAAHLTAGVYLIKFNTADGKQATTKIIKK
ncbi:MAG: T9SS type A sorting domain-containing protein [Mesonia sp.]|uniref:T9SS type A sorting domain-containing protein n=1 Tax=Mesonia sp. TaxID=1960830 RepID=UPI003F97330B